MRKRDRKVLALSDLTKKVEALKTTREDDRPLLATGALAFRIVGTKKPVEKYKLN